MTKGTKNKDISWVQFVAWPIVVLAALFLFRGPITKFIGDATDTDIEVNEHGFSIHAKRPFADGTPMPGPGDTGSIAVATPSTTPSTTPSATPSDLTLRKELVGVWKGQISTTGVFTFTLSFAEDGSFQGDGKYVYGEEKVQSMISGTWSVQGGHINTTGGRKTSGDITDVGGHEAIGEAYSEYKKIIEITDKTLVFSPINSTATISLDRVP